MSKTGTVKFFNSQKGFGFITQSDGGPDMFVHANDVQGNPLQEGDEVQYEPEWDDRKQKDHAVQVTGGTGQDFGGGGKGFGKGKGKGKGKSYDSYGGGGYGGGGSYGGGGYGGGGYGGY